MTLVNGSSSVVLSNVAQLIHQKSSTDSALIIEQFFELLYQNISPLDLSDRNDSDIYGATLSLWNSFYKYSNKAPYIKVFNPRISRDGWKSNHTVIEIIVNDTPFLVDSLRNSLSRLGITPHLFINRPLKVIRNKNNVIEQLSDSSVLDFNETTRESVFFIEIDLQDDQDILDKIESDIRSVLNDIELIVCDSELMKAKLEQVTCNLEKSNLPCTNNEKSETLAFLNWLLQDNFTLMGYKSYSLKALVGDVALVSESKSALGFMKNSNSTKQRLLSTFSEPAREVALGSSPLILTKTNTKSCIHRSVYFDYIGIKQFDSEGNVVGEERFIGMFGPAYSTNSALDIPVLSAKINSVCELSGFASGSHAYKSVVNILETYPRDEILQSSANELLAHVLGILQMQERDYTGLFVRNDVFNRFYSCMVYVPRERYNTSLRIATQAH